MLRKCSTTEYTLKPLPLKLVSTFFFFKVHCMCVEMKTGGRSSPNHDEDCMLVRQSGKQAGPRTSHILFASAFV